MDIELLASSFVLGSHFRNNGNSVTYPVIEVMVGLLIDTAKTAVHMPADEVNQLVLCEISKRFSIRIAFQKLFHVSLVNGFGRWVCGIIRHGQ